MALASLDSLMKDIEENFSLGEIQETSGLITKGASTVAGDDDDEPVMVTAEQLLSRRAAPIGQFHFFNSFHFISVSFIFSFIFICSFVLVLLIGCLCLCFNSGRDEEDQC